MEAEKPKREATPFPSEVPPPESMPKLELSPPSTEAISQEPTQEEVEMSETAPEIHEDVPMTSTEGPIKKISFKEDDTVIPQSEIIVEQEFSAKPKMPLLEEESMKDSIELIPIIPRSRKSRSSSKSRRASSKSENKTRKYKRCKKNHRRSKKTHRCNKKCPPGHKRSMASRRCVKKN